MRKQQMRRCGDRKGFVVLQELKEDKNGPGGGAGPGEPFKKGNVLETAMLSHPNIHCSINYNSQDMEVTCVHQG